MRGAFLSSNWLPFFIIITHDPLRIRRYSSIMTPLPFAPAQHYQPLAMTQPSLA